jgi:hypothetical protein
VPFVDPDIELDALKEDLAWPLVLSTAGDLAAVRGIPNVESALVARAITGRREIPHRPQYGTDWEDLQNGPSIEEESATLEARLLEQYQRDARVESVTVTVMTDPNNPSDTIARVHADILTGDAASADVVLTTGRET